MRCADNRSGHCKYQERCFALFLMCHCEECGQMRLCAVGMLVMFTGSGRSQLMCV